MTTSNVEAAMAKQKRSRSIAMTKPELDSFLGQHRTCRVATVSPGGRPHVAPLWFVWDGEYLWLTSVTRSQRWKDVQDNPRVAIVCDGGEAYAELHGVEIEGEAEVVGEVPRVGEPRPDLEVPERLFADKYIGKGEPFAHDGRHAWLRVTPDKVTSWDFRKVAGKAG